MKPKTSIIWLILIILLIGGMGWTLYQWQLCREAGMSFWYCIQHIG